MSETLDLIRWCAETGHGETYERRIELTPRMCRYLLSLLEDPE